MEHTTFGKTKRVAIIGAGAAGLTAAETLRRKGYEHVTIFERNDRAGGKCSTMQIDGRSYELGAGVLAANNRTVMGLAQRYGIQTERAVFGNSLLVDAITGTLLPKRNLQNTVTLLRQLFFHYRKLLRRYQRITDAGFLHIPPELCVPFSSWVKEHHLETLATEFAPAFTGYGYGYFDDIPAAYVLKYYSWATIRSFLLRQMIIFPNGIQELWNAVAATHDVQYNTIIQQITRTQDTVSIVTDAGKSFNYDRLIITSPFDEALNFLDATQEESNLFSCIQYLDYRTIVCELNNFPKYSGYVPGNYMRERSGHPIFWYHRHHDTPIYTFYVLADGKMNDDAIANNVQQLVERMGGTVKRIHTVASWKYFPHIHAHNMKSGYFDQLEKLQGNHRTYYAGELLNFSTVGLTADYAQHLVKRFF